MVIASIVVNTNLVMTDKMLVTNLIGTTESLENSKDDSRYEPIEEVTERVGIRPWVVSLIKFWDVGRITESVLVAPAVWHDKFRWGNKIVAIIAGMCFVENGSEEIEGAEARAGHSIRYLRARKRR